MATVAPPQTPADASAAAPAPGTTGTIALPALPVPAGTDPGHGSVLPARAFSMSAASPIGRPTAHPCPPDPVYYETASASAARHRAVRQAVHHASPPPSVPAPGGRDVSQG